MRVLYSAALGLKGSSVLFAMGLSDTLSTGLVSAALASGTVAVAELSFSVGEALFPVFAPGLSGERSEPGWELTRASFCWASCSSRAASKTGLILLAP